MTSEIKSVASQAWKDLVSSASLFVSFCGVVGACANVANAFSPRCMQGLESFIKPQSATQVKSDKTGNS